MHPARPYKQVPLIVTAGALLFASIILQACSPQENAQNPTDTPERITVSGTTECLPHKDTDGPQTMECALGLKATDGSHYAMDLSILERQFDFQTNKEVTIEGVLVPIEQISSNQWQKYDIKGIVQVASLTER